MATIFHAEIPINLAAPSIMRPITDQLFYGDNGSHIFTALVGDTDAPDAGILTGTVSGAALRADGSTIPLEGTKGAETVPVTFQGVTVQATPCSVILNQEALAYPGSLVITISVTDGETVTSAAVFSATVLQAQTDAIVDPGELIPGVAALQAAAAAALEAAGDAESAAAAATTAASKAVRYDTAQSLSAVQQKTARANIEAEIASATRLVLSTPGYVAATASATTVEVDANGDPVNAAPTSTAAVHEVLSISPGDRFCALTPANYSTNTRMWMILGAVNTATTPHTRPILAKFDTVSELTMYTAPTGAELIVFYTSKTRQNNGTDVYYMGAQTVARADYLEDAIGKRVRFDEAQALTDTEKATARANIGAYAAEETGLEPIALASGYVNTSVSPVNPTPSPSGTGYTYAIVDCSPGDLFKITAAGGGSPRAWCFIDAANNRLAWANANTFAENMWVSAPPLAVKLIINHNVNGMPGAKSYKAGTLSSVEQHDAAVSLVHNTGRHGFWESGSLSVSTGEPYASASQIRTTIRLGYKDGVTRITSDGVENVGAYSVPEFDALVDQAMDAESFDERLSLFAQAEALLLDGAYMIPVISSLRGYHMTYEVPYTRPLCLYGSDRYKGLKVKDKPVTLAEYEQLTAAWEAARDAD